MRMTLPITIVAAAFIAAGPALAQNDTNAATADVNATAADNAAAPDMNTMPPPVASESTLPATEPPPIPADEKNTSFPWGVLGLVGLIGLLGRRRS